jgi:hypothetical protein
MTRRENEMPFVPVPNGAEVSLHGKLSGQDAVTTFNVTKPGSWDASNLDTLTAAVDTFWNATLKALMSTSYQYLFTRARDMRTVIGFQSENGDHAGFGTETGVALPNNSTIAIARKSGMTGRSSNGRIFWPGMTQDMLVDDNHVNDTWSAAATGALNTLSDLFDSLSWTEVIVQRSAAGVPLAEAVVWTVAEYIMVDKVLDSMRRRLPGRGA